MKRIFSILITTTFLFLFWETSIYSYTNINPSCITLVKEVQSQETRNILFTPSLNSIEINNLPATPNKDNIVVVSYNDSVRISGDANPGDTVRVYFSDKVYDSIADKFGNWFVLFSFVEKEDKAFPVYAQIVNSNSDNDKTKLVILSPDESFKLDNQENKETDNIECKSSSIYIVILLAIIFLIEVIRLSIYLKRKKK